MVRLGDIKIKTTVKEELQTGELEVFAKAHIEHDKETETADRKKIFLWAYLTDEDGNEADRIFPIEVQKQMQFCMRVDPPCLWNAEECYLYDLILELRDEENELQGCMIKKIAFFRWETADGVRCLNGKSIKFALAPQEITDRCRRTGEDTCAESEELMREVLKGLKLSGRNALYMEKGSQTQMLQELCLKYGIYLLDEMPCEGEIQKNEDHFGFELQVVEQGVLIENRNVFADADIYDLCYEILCGGRIVQRGAIQAKVAAGNSRFIELPFAKPKAPGVYCYRAALCLKRDAVWAKKGYEVAKGETIISNLWLE